MTDIDLSAAVDAAAACAARVRQGEAWERLDGYAKHMWRDGIYREINAAAPFVEAAVRAAVFAEIRDDRERLRNAPEVDERRVAAYLAGMSRAMKIALDGTA